MRYSTFELLAAIVGTAAIIGTVVAGIAGGSMYQEIVAQLLLLPVLLAALHFGRKGGFIAALFAIAVYVGLYIPNLADIGLSQPLVSLIAARALVYMVVGVLGGELCSRIKYVFVSLEQSDLIDAETGVYSRRYVGSLLRNLIESNQRYGAAFSAALLTVDGETASALAAKDSRRKTFMRDLAAAVRADVRAVDEVGRGSNGGLVVLFPHTPCAGGQVAADRLRRTVATLLDRRGAAQPADAVTAEVLSFPEAEERLVSLVEELTGEPFRVPEPPAAAPEPARS